LTWNTFRKHLILEYEVIKYDGYLGSPNFLIPLPDFAGVSAREKMEEELLESLQIKK
jgi:hypothetical protein